MTPRYQWTPASEPPDSARHVVVWIRFQDGLETWGKVIGGPAGFGWQNGIVTHWRDVEGPTEAPK